MMGWILGKLKWLAVLCAVGGPILAVACWQDGERRKEVMATGIQAEAAIDSATRVKRRRGGTSYKLDLSWTDAGGLRHRAEGVSISHALARQIIVDDKLVADTLPVRYAKGESGSKGDENVIVLADTAHQSESDEAMITVGAGAGILGLIGSALFFLPRRRRTDAVAA